MFLLHSQQITENINQQPYIPPKLFDNNQHFPC